MGSTLVCTVVAVNHGTRRSQESPPLPTLALSTRLDGFQIKHLALMETYCMAAIAATRTRRSEWIWKRVYNLFIVHIVICVTAQLSSAQPSPSRLQQDVTTGKYGCKSCRGGGHPPARRESVPRILPSRSRNGRSWFIPGHSGENAHQHQRVSLSQASSGS